ncbi:MAG: hypothetical protein ABIV13_01180 [Fimbriimonadales bacterium]
MAIYFAIIGLLIAIPQSRFGIAEGLGYFTNKWEEDEYHGGQNRSRNDIRLPKGTDAISRVVAAQLDYESSNSVLTDLQTLREEFPGDLFVLTIWINTAWPSGSVIERQGEKSDAEYEEARKKLDPRRRQLIEAADTGRALEPENAYFPLVAAVAYEGMGDGVQARRLVETAANCANFNDREKELIDVMTAVLRQDRYDPYREQLARDGRLWTAQVVGAIRLAAAYKEDQSDNGVRTKFYIIETVLKMIRTEGQIWNLLSFRYAIQQVIGTTNPWKNPEKALAEVSDFQKRCEGLGMKPSTNYPELCKSLGALTEKLDADLDDEGDLAYWNYAPAVSDCAEALVSTLVVLLMALGFYLLSLIKGRFPPRASIPPLIAGLLAFVFALFGAIADLAYFHLAAFGLVLLAVAFLAAERTTQRTGQVLGIAVMMACCVAAVMNREGQGVELGLAISYGVGSIRYAWLTRTGPSRGLFVPIMCLVLCCLAFVYANFSISEIGWVLLVLTGLTLAVTMVIQSVSIGDAAKQLLRSTPWAGCLALVLAGYLAIQISRYAAEIDATYRGEAQFVSQIRREVGLVP